MPLRIFLCGDVMTGRGIDQVLPFPVDPRLYESYVKDARDYVALSEQRNGPVPRPVGFEYIWGAALGVWKRMQPDLKIVNLETSVTRSDEPWPGKGIHYRMSPENIGCLTSAGIGFCALANNHVLDWGYPGLLETLGTLSKANIKTAGAGTNITEAAAPFRLDVAAKGSVLVVSMGLSDSGIPSDWAASDERPGVFLIEPEMRGLNRLLEAVCSIRRPGEILIASIHWGFNWVREIPRSHVLFAHKLIDELNVDIVHGHSSHHALGIEVYRGHLILYGCGDMVTDYEGISGYESFRGDLGLMYFADLDEAGNLVELRMFPVQMRQFRLSRPPQEDISWLEDTLNDNGEEFETRVTRDNDGFMLRWQ